MPATVTTITVRRNSRWKNSWQWEKVSFWKIEVEGAMKVRAARPDAVFVFILPPSMTELENRLRGRGTEAEEVVQKRVAQAKQGNRFCGKIRLRCD